MAVISVAEICFLPLSAVLVAQLAHFHFIGIFPHQRVIFPWYALGTSGHAEQPVLEVGTLCAVSRALERMGCTNIMVRDVYNALEE